MSIDQDKNVIWKESIIRNNIYIYLIIYIRFVKRENINNIESFLYKSN